MDLFVLLLNLLIATFINLNINKVEGLNCLECYSCTGKENKTCYVEDGYCMSAIIRVTEKDEYGVIRPKDEINIMRTCHQKTESFPIFCQVGDKVKHLQNVRCCNDQDFCNAITPELAADPTKKKDVDEESLRCTPTLVLVIVLPTTFLMTALLAGIMLYHYCHKPGHPHALPLHQNSDTNLLAQPSPLKDLYDCSQSGSESVYLCDGNLDERKMLK
ncbi:uncharacterized protein LOC106050378 [Biomphalaria glabrata]|uniref:Uncharacterized protein LOC106050378 n=1 Tax=Biomphalaria glabrata TaxID=6526 RepID=A0A9U8DUS1_BIOGL|nr:uncharacterized protein LOC106050378 [Biomphalaria glabrata]